MGSQAGDGYKSTEIFLVIMLDPFAVGVPRSLYPYHVKVEEYQPSDAEVHYENFALFCSTIFLLIRVERLGFCLCFHHQKNSNVTFEQQDA